MRRAKYILFLGFIGAIAFVAFQFISAPQPGSVEYHLKLAELLRGNDVWNAAPKNALDYLKPKTWRWYRAGRPTEQSFIQDTEEQQLALIRLGYFERREFTLRNRPLDAQFWYAYATALSNSPLQDQRWFALLGYGKPPTIRMTGCTSDMPFFEKLLNEMDTNVSNIK